MKLRAAEVLSVVLFHWTLELKDQSKTVGVARQQLHFLCSDTENEAKESLGAALGMSGASRRHHQFR